MRPISICRVLLATMCIAKASAGEAALADLLKQAQPMQLVAESATVLLSSPRRQPPNGFWRLDMVFPVPDGFMLPFLDDSPDGDHSTFARVLVASTDAGELLAVNGYDRAHQRNVRGGRFGFGRKSGKPAKLLLCLEFPAPQQPCQKIRELSGFLTATIVAGQDKEISIAAADAIKGTTVDVGWPPGALVSLTYGKQELLVSGSAMAMSTLLETWIGDANGKAIVPRGRFSSSRSVDGVKKWLRQDLPEDGMVRLRLASEVTVVRCSYTLKDIAVESKPVVQQGAPTSVPPGPGGQPADF